MGCLVDVWGSRYHCFLLTFEEDDMMVRWWIDGWLLQRCSGPVGVPSQRVSPEINSACAQFLLLQFCKRPSNFNSHKTAVTSRMLPLQNKYLLGHLIRISKHHPRCAHTPSPSSFATGSEAIPAHTRCHWPSCRDPSDANPVEPRATPTRADFHAEERGTRDERT